MIKTKKDFLLRSLGSESVIIGIGGESKSINGMIRLNATGVFYWNELQKGTTVDALTQKTLERFEDADEETARADIQDFLKAIADTLEDDGSDN